MSSEHPDFERVDVATSTTPPQEILRNLLDSGEHDQVRNVCHAFISTSEPEIRGIGYLYIGHAEEAERHYQQAIDNYSKAAAEFVGADKLVCAADALSAQAEVHSHFGELSEAQHLFEEAIELHQSQPDRANRRKLARQYLGLADVLCDQNLLAETEALIPAITKQAFEPLEKILLGTMKTKLYTRLASETTSPGRRRLYAIKSRMSALYLDRLVDKYVDELPQRLSHLANTPDELNRIEELRDRLKAEAKQSSH